MPNLLPVLKTMSSRMFIMMPKNTTLLEVHFVAWKWRKTMPGMTVGVGIGKKNTSVMKQRTKLVIGFNYRCMKICLRARKISTASILTLIYYIAIFML